MGGGSYGGYLSLLIAKIAPWYVDGVIDNSGSALPPLNYILGREMEHSYGGCGIPDKALFRKELPLMLEKLQKRKSFMQENSISYPCGNKVFIFKDVGDKFELVIKD